MVSFRVPFGGISSVAMSKISPEIAVSTNAQTASEMAQELLNVRKEYAESIYGAFLFGQSGNDEIYNGSVYDTVLFNTTARDCMYSK